MDEYNLGAEFCRQSFHKGGVCMYSYILKRFLFSAINIKYYKDKELEACAIKLKLLSMNVCVLAVYRSPNGNFQFFLYGLENVLKKVYKSSICADINYLDEIKEKKKRTITN
jgi:hypothetical protein